MIYVGEIWNQSETVCRSSEVFNMYKYVLLDESIWTYLEYVTCYMKHFEI